MEYNEKQIQIIGAAERLFAENGFEGSSVRDIAQMAGVNIAMISYYFGSKEKLMEAILAQRMESTAIRINNLLEKREMSALQKVNVLIDDYVDRFLQQQEFHKIMMREQMINKDNNITCLIYESKKKSLELIKKLINEGQKNGEFRKSIDIPMMMITLVGTLSQLTTTQHFYRLTNNLQTMPDADFQKLIRRKLTTHLKSLFKTTLTYEA